MQSGRVRNQKHKTKTGFTLAELLVVILISGALFTALATFTHSSLDTTEVRQDTNLAQHTARTALERFAREAGLATLISAAEEYRLTFTCTDITGDGSDDEVEYDWDSDTQELTRTLNGTAETFADNVTLFALEYQYETEDEVTIAAPGDAMPMTLGSFSGVETGGEDHEVDVTTWTDIAQYFDNKVEVPAATSVTIRARTKMLPPPSDMLIYLENSDQTVAQGTLNGSQLTTRFEDVTVPLTWIGGDATMEPDRNYCLYIQPEDPWPYSVYAGTIQYQEIEDGPGLGGGLLFWYSWHWFGDRASMYFTVSGDLPITTPRRSSVPRSVLKTVKATIRVAEGDEQAELSRTCKVLNQ